MLRQINRIPFATQEKNSQKYFGQIKQKLSDTYTRSELKNTIDQTADSFEKELMSEFGMFDKRVEWAKLKAYAYFGLIHEINELMDNKSKMSRMFSASMILWGLMLGGHLKTNQDALKTLTEIKDPYLSHKIVQYYPNIKPSLPKHLSENITPKLEKLYKQSLEIQHVMKVDNGDYEHSQIKGKIIANLKQYSANSGHFHKDKRGAELAEACLANKSTETLYQTLNNQALLFFNSSKRKDKKYVEAINHEIKKLRK